MSFGIDRRARSRKGRGWFRKAPGAREVGDRLGWLVRRMGKGLVRQAGWKQERFIAELALHPAAPPAMVSIEPDGELVARAETAHVGPGYHADVMARLAPILDELDYGWTEPFDPAGVQDEMCAWLAGELRGDGQRRIAMPAGRTFVVDAPVLTPLGPRDAVWRDAVLAEPRRGADAFAWWEPGAPGHAARSRALLAMWHEVPWREPIAAEERALMAQVDTNLCEARKADPELELPWADWAELVELLGRDADELRARAGGRAPAIGYRRHDLEVELSGGWLVELPGSFLSGWEDDGARYWGTDGDRSVDFTSMTADDAVDSDQLLAVAPERHPVVARRTDGACRGRAEAYDDDGVRVVIGLVACAPHVGILTCKGDEAWSLATWRSLRRG